MIIFSNNVCPHLQTLYPNDRMKTVFKSKFVRVIRKSSLNENPVAITVQIMDI